MGVSLTNYFPGYNRIYRCWHVHGNNGGISFDHKLSAIPRFAGHSIHGTGCANMVICPFGRNIDTPDQLSDTGILSDNFLAVKRLARQLRTNAIVNLAKAVKNTFLKAPAANPFRESIVNSIHCIYRTMSNDACSRMDGQFGANATSTWGQITQLPHFEKGILSISPC